MIPYLKPDLVEIIAEFVMARGRSARNGQVLLFDQDTLKAAILEGITKYVEASSDQLDHLTSGEEL